MLERSTLTRFNRLLMFSTYLSRRAKGKDSPLTVADACVGINSQNLLESYGSFWARSDNFRDSDLDSEMRKKKRLLRARTIRGTMHTFPAADYYTYVLGSPNERALERYDTWAKTLKMPPREDRVKLLYDPLMEEMRGKPVSASMIEEFMAERLESIGIRGKRKLRRGWSNQATYGVTWSGIEEMSRLGFIVNTGKDGTNSSWTRTEDVSGIPRQKPDSTQAKVELIKLYVRNYGPVRESDILYWSGHFKRDVRYCLKELKGIVKEEKFHNSDETYFSLKNDLREALEPPEVVILPKFDSLLMGYEEKDRIIPAGKRGMIFTTLGVIKPTILLDGFVAGTWVFNAARNSHKVTVSVFGELSPSRKRSIRDEFDEYGKYKNLDMQTIFQTS